MKRTDTPAQGTIVTREWREKNPERYDDQIRRASKKLLAKKALIRLQLKRDIYHPKKNLIGQIQRHVNKGRDVATIANWLDVPMSTIAATIEKFSIKPI